MLDSSVEHFRAGLQALRDERAQLLQSLRSINTQIEATENFLSSIEPQASTRPPTSGEPPAVRDVLLQIARRGEVFSFGDVMRELRAVGNTAQDASVSSIISREPTIERGPRRGTYRITKSEAPDFSEASVSHIHTAVGAVDDGKEQDRDSDRDHHPAIGMS